MYDERIPPFSISNVDSGAVVPNPDADNVAKKKSKFNFPKLGKSQPDAKPEKAKFKKHGSEVVVDGSSAKERIGEGATNGKRQTDSEPAALEIKQPTIHSTPEIQQNSEVSKEQVHVECRHLELEYSRNESEPSKQMPPGKYFDVSKRAIIQA